MAFEIKDPPEFTTDVEQWTRETDADGAQMAKVIEKLLNNEVFLKGLIEKLDGNAVKAGDKGIPEGVASLGADGKLEQRVDYDKIDDVPAPAWGNITGKPSNYSPSSHTHAKSEVGLGNVDNTADARKSVSYAANAGDADTVDGKHASAFAASSHTHSAATQSAAGLMSANDKKKLDGVATGANAYSHPTGNGNNHIPSGGASGQILRWSAAGTATWGSDNNTTYSAATQSAQGLMSAADKKKLDGITAGANMLKSDIVNNCTSTYTDKPLAANQGKVLMEKFNQLNSDKVAKSENPLYFRGTITGNLNRLDISPGYYVIGASGTVSNGVTNEGDSYCQFIQFGDGYKTQMIIDGTGPHTRSYIGSPSSWTPWTGTKPHITVKKFTKSGKFDTYGCYNVPITIPSGYRFGFIAQIVTNGWIGGGYGYPVGNSVDIWVHSGFTASGSIDVYIAFIL